MRAVNIIIWILRFIVYPVVGLVVVFLSYWFSNGFIEEADYFYPLWMLPGILFISGYAIQFHRKFVWIGAALILLSVASFYFPISYRDWRI